VSARRLLLERFQVLCVLPVLFNRFVALYPEGKDDAMCSKSQWKALEEL
jgi:hypothetical protein